MSASAAAFRRRRATASVCVFDRNCVCPVPTQCRFGTKSSFIYSPKNQKRLLAKENAPATSRKERSRCLLVFRFLFGGWSDISESKKNRWNRFSHSNCKTLFVLNLVFINVADKKNPLCFCCYASGQIGS